MKATAIQMLDQRATDRRAIVVVVGLNGGRGGRCGRSVVRHVCGLRMNVWYQLGTTLVPMEPSWYSVSSIGTNGAHLLTLGPLGTNGAQ